MKLKNAYLPHRFSLLKFNKAEGNEAAQREIAYQYFRNDAPVVDKIMRMEMEGDHGQAAERNHART